MENSKASASDRTLVGDKTTNKTVENSPSLFNDAYNLGGQILKSTKHTIQANPEITLAVGALALLATHGKGAAALAERVFAADGKALTGAAAKLGSSGERIGPHVFQKVDLPGPWSLKPGNEVIPTRLDGTGPHTMKKVDGVWDGDRLRHSGQVIDLDPSAVRVIDEKAKLLGR